MGNLIDTEIKRNHPLVSYADLYQLASARAIEYTGGGPNLKIRYGRQDAPQGFQAEGNLPDGEASSSKSTTNQEETGTETGTDTDKKSNVEDTTKTFGGKGGTASTESNTAGGHLRKV